MPSAAGSLDATLALPPSRLVRPALFLDLDGVLAPIEPRPDAVGPSPERTALLRALVARLDERVAVVSGRSITDIDRILEAAVPAAAGVHGLQRRRADGVLEKAATPPGMVETVAEMQAFAETRPGVLVENKGVAASLHYRLAPQQEAAALALGERLAQRFDLAVQPGKMIVELKARGADKGTALTAFMAERPFRDGLPVMVGDDLTDEFAFKAAERLGGFGVLVGHERPTAARYRLDDSEAVAVWLAALEATP